MGSMVKICSLCVFKAGIAQLARASAFQAEGREFESRFPLQLKLCPCGSGVEHTLGKGEVASSILAMGFANGRDMLLEIL